MSTTVQLALGAVAFMVVSGGFVAVAIARFKKDFPAVPAVGVDSDQGQNQAAQRARS